MTMHIGSTFHIGNKRRVFRASMRALRRAQQDLPGWMTVPKALERVDVGILCILAAALLVDEDKTVSPDDVEKWLDAEPESFASLASVVVEEIAKGYRRTMTAEQRAKLERAEAEERARRAALGEEEGDGPLGEDGQTPPA